MRRQPHQAVFFFQQTNDAHDAFALCFVFPCVVEIAEQPAGTDHAADIHVKETGVFDLRFQFFRFVEISEPQPAADVHACFHRPFQAAENVVTIQRGLSLFIINRNEVQRGGVGGDVCGKQQTAWL